MLFTAFQEELIGKSYSNSKSRCFSVLGNSFHSNKTEKKSDFCPPLLQQKKKVRRGVPIKNSFLFPLVIISASKQFVNTLKNVF